MVRPEPSGSRRSDFFDDFKHVLRKTVVPHRPVDTFDTGVLAGLPRWEEVQLNAPALR